MTRPQDAGFLPGMKPGPEIRLFPVVLHCYALGWLSAHDPEALEHFLQDGPS